jgi:hypothetical protein
MQIAVSCGVRSCFSLTPLGNAAQALVPLQLWASAYYAIQPLGSFFSRLAPISALMTVPHHSIAASPGCCSSLISRGSSSGSVCLGAAHLPRCPQHSRIIAFAFAVSSCVCSCECIPSPTT